MILWETFTKRGKRIILNTERWNHLVLRHPEMNEYLEEIKETLQNPDIIVKDNFEPSVILYHKYYKVRGIYIVTVVDEDKGFILTSYTTDTPKRGIILWQKR